MSPEPSDDDIQFAGDRADYAIDELDAKLTDAVRAALRKMLVDDFLFTEHGRLELEGARNARHERISSAHKK